MKHDKECRGTASAKCNTNACETALNREKRTSERQQRKGKRHPSEYSFPKNSKERKESLSQ